MLRIIIKNAVVDFVGKNQQLVLAGNIHNLLQDFPGIHRTGGIIGVDHHNGFGFVGDFRLDVLNRGVPVVLFIAQVVHGFAAGKGGSGGPQWVIRGGNQHLVAVVEQGLGDHGNKLGHAIAQEHIVHIKVGEIRDDLVAGDNGAACRDDAFRGGIALRGGQGSDHIPHDHIGCLETEHGGGAGVELEHAVPVHFQAFRFRSHRPPDLIQDVLHLLRLVKDAGAPAFLGFRGWLWGWLRIVWILWVFGMLAHPNYVATFRPSRKGDGGVLGEVSRAYRRPACRRLTVQVREAVEKR